MTKKKISRFEFAIMEVADPESAKNYEPYTEEEENQQRADKLSATLSQLKFKKPAGEKEVHK